MPVCRTCPPADRLMLDVTSPLLPPSRPRPHDWESPSPFPLDRHSRPGFLGPLFPQVMSIYAWCTRRAAGLAMGALIGLSSWVVTKEAAAYGKLMPDPSNPPTSRAGAGHLTHVFAWYCLLVHFLVVIFPLRACWSILDLSRRLKQRFDHSKSCVNYALVHCRWASSGSFSSSKTLTQSTEPTEPTEPSMYSSRASTPSEAEQGSSHVAYCKSEPRVVHAIIIPNYKEEMDTLRETLDVLASHAQARDFYDVSSI